jgi:hypothetical protein
MPGPPFGPLVADHDHGAGLDVTGQDRLHRERLVVEHPGRTLEVHLCIGGQSGDLDHRTLRRERSGEDVDAARLVDRRVERVHHHAVGGGWIDLGEVLGHRPAGHRHHVAVQESGVEQQLQHDGHTADAVEVAHVELAARLHVGDVRHLVGDAVEVVEVEVDAVPRWRARGGGARRSSNRRAPR